MGQSLAQKIIAKAVGKDYVTPGVVEIANIDLAMIHDSGGPRRVKPILDRLGVDVWSSEKIVVVTDHYVPEFNNETKAIQKLTRDWVKTNNIRSFYDQMGICHVVVPENGHLKPGMFVVGGDSHSPTGGAFGEYMFGIGATEMAGVLATGEIWIKVPETIGINWSGKLNDFVTAKDMMLYACGKLGMDGGKYQAVEFSGSAISALDMQERMTLSNMTAELGGQAGIIAPDDVTKRYLKNVGSIDIDIIGGDITSCISGLTISITSIGNCSKNDLVFRSGAKENDLLVEKVDGMKFNILTDQWSLSRDKSINYIAKFIKN